MRHAIGFLFSAVIFTTQSGHAAEPKFERQVIDPAIAIGYGLAIGDVDGDKKSDILLADKSQIAWYRNGDWKRFVMAENLNPRVGTRFLDNVCIAARDIDGDGKVEVAVGGNWNPGETKDAAKSGSVHYLTRPDDPTARWKPVKLEHSPTIHRMHWVNTGAKQFSLTVLPLHGVGNKGGKGDPVQLLSFSVPADPAAGKWPLQRIDTGLHATHNFDWMSVEGGIDAIMIGGAEGVLSGRIKDGKWAGSMTVEAPLSRGVGEVRGVEIGDKGGIVVIEPMHGNEVVMYRPSEKAGAALERVVLDASLSQGHAIAVADLLGSGSAQVIAGWRRPDANKKVGIKLYARDGDAWKTHLIDDNGMACEDLKVTDLDGDGKLDIIAAGRATKNVVVYWNRTGSKP